MAEIKQLRNPPIHEAVIEVKFDGCSIDEATLESFVKERQKNLPDWHILSLRTMEATFEFNSDTLPALSETPDGFWLKNEDGTKIVLFKKNSVTANHIKKYSTWDLLVNDFETALLPYIDLMKTAMVVGISARFVNRIVLSKPDNSDFRDYLSEEIGVPSGLESGEMTDFNTVRIVRNIKDDFFAKINVATVSPFPTETTNSLLIDIDVFKICNIEPNLALIQDELNKIRAIKNKIFFGLMKESGLEKYK